MDVISLFFQHGTGRAGWDQHPEAAQQIRDDPALIGPAVEELLRYDSPIQIAW